MVYSKQHALVVFERMRKKYPVVVTGDACVGDHVCYLEPFLDVRRHKLLFRVVRAEIIRDSYEKYEERRPHMFTLSDEDGHQFLRPAKTVYAYGTFAVWRDPTERTKYLVEKHARGAAARFLRDKRKEAS